MRLTAQQIYDKLVNEDRILELKGQIRFYFGDVDIVVKQKDVVGNIIQEWLQGWLDKRGIEYAPSENTQMPPDFYLMFRSLEDFVAAIEETVWQNPKTRDISATWKRRFLESYEKFYGIKLDVPRWTDIADTYLS